MKWQGRRGSRNIEDRRGQGGARGGAKVGGVGLLALVVVGYFLGIDVTPLLNGNSGLQSSSGASQEITPADQQAAEFVSVTLADTEDV